MNIYEKVKTACADNNISIIELERQLGFSRGSIFKWDTSKPSVDRVQKVAKKLNKPIEFFLE